MAFVGAVGPLFLDGKGVLVQLTGLLGEIAGALAVVNSAGVGVVPALLVLCGVRLKVLDKK